MQSFFVFFLGISVGSFLNVLIDRLPKGENVLVGRSHCDFCKKTLRWYELIPLVSFFIQGGRCRRCHKKLSLQYPLVELATGVVFVWIWLQSSMNDTSMYRYIEVSSLWVISSSLFVIFVADLKYQIIPDSMIIAGTIGAVLRLTTITRGLTIVGISPYVLSGLGAAGFFFLLWVVTGGRGMGLGDVKLVFLLGFVLGFPRIIVALYAAFLTGAFVGVILILSRRKSLKAKVPFGPFLISGFLIALQWAFPIERLLGLL